MAEAAEKTTDQANITITLGEILVCAERAGQTVVLALLKEITRLRREVADRDQIVAGRTATLAALQDALEHLPAETREQVIAAAGKAMNALREASKATLL